MKRIIAVILTLSLLITGCAAKSETPTGKQYNATFLTLFDTVTTIVGRAESEEDFKATAQAIHDELLEYHRLFDIYNEYEGMVNLKVINDNAAVTPVKTDERIIDLLIDCKAFYKATDGKVNAAMGSVLSLWHESRSDGRDDPVNAKLPDIEELRAASMHMDFDSVVIDKEACTVYFTDPDVKLDVGAVAKGWAVQQVAETAPKNLLISVGGNIVATGPKTPEGDAWVIGIQDPNGGEDYLHTIYVKNGSVVTSGDYQRTYMVDGKLYHHIIDPETLYPSEYWRSVSVVCDDSGAADALSTALFILPQDEGQSLLDKYGAKAMWVDANGDMFYSEGFKDLIRT
ncbi:MAG: FAD:protein FMN transferase [Clostridia bacterium]|nr:FAD:protein FMN transferase [Clostridia bacterium]